MQKTAPIKKRFKPNCAGNHPAKNQKNINYERMFDKLKITGSDPKHKFIFVKIIIISELTATFCKICRCTIKQEVRISQYILKQTD